MAVAGLFNAKGEMPFFTDAVSAATGVAFVARGLPVLHKIHYTGTMLLADVLYKPSAVFVSFAWGPGFFIAEHSAHAFWDLFLRRALCR